jgi:hypothetical protein
MSMMREPALVPSSRPPSPATTCSTLGGPGSMVTIMLHFSATSLGESATSARGEARSGRPMTLLARQKGS